MVVAVAFFKHIHIVSFIATSTVEMTVIPLVIFFFEVEPLHLNCCYFCLCRACTCNLLAQIQHFKFTVPSWLVMYTWTRWLYCVEWTQYSIRLGEMVHYLPAKKFWLPVKLSLRCGSCPKSPGPAPSISLLMFQIASKSVHFRVSAELYRNAWRPFFCPIE